MHIVVKKTLTYCVNTALLSGEVYYHETSSGGLSLVTIHEQFNFQIVHYILPCATDIVCACTFNCSVAYEISMVASCLLLNVITAVLLLQSFYCHFLASMFARENYHSWMNLILVRYNIFGP